MGEATQQSVADNLLTVRRLIDQAAQAVGRAPGEVNIIAVSKAQPLARVEAALAAGHRLFGENRVQEAEEKWPNLRSAYPDVELHMIGHLQSNKAADAVNLFDAIHSVDRPKIAKALGKAMHKIGRQLPCFVQVNTGEEPQKGGVAPTQAEAFVEECRNVHGLNIVGLMCIPPLDEDPAPHFALLADMARRLGLARLSMGMSDDYETAVRLGATDVRVGTSIFGARMGR